MNNIELIQHLEELVSPVHVVKHDGEIIYSSTTRKLNNELFTDETLRLQFADYLFQLDEPLYLSASRRYAGMLFSNGDYLMIGPVMWIKAPKLGYSSVNRANSAWINLPQGRKMSLLHAGEAKAHLQQVDNVESSVFGNQPETLLNIDDALYFQYVVLSEEQAEKQFIVASTQYTNLPMSSLSASYKSAKASSERKNNLAATVSSLSSTKVNIASANNYLDNELALGNIHELEVQAKAKSKQDDKAITYVGFMDYSPLFLSSNIKSKMCITQIEHYLVHSLDVVILGQVVSVIKSQYNNADKALEILENPSKVSMRQLESARQLLLAHHKTLELTVISNLGNNELLNGAKQDKLDAKDLVDSKLACDKEPKGGVALTQEQNFVADKQASDTQALDKCALANQVLDNKASSNAILANLAVSKADASFDQLNESKALNKEGAAKLLGANVGSEQANSSNSDTISEQSHKNEQPQSLWHTYSLSQLRSKSPTLVKKQTAAKNQLMLDKLWSAMLISEGANFTIRDAFENQFLPGDMVSVLPDYDSLHVWADSADALHNQTNHANHVDNLDIKHTNHVYKSVVNQVLTEASSTDLEYLQANKELDKANASLLDVNLLSTQLKDKNDLAKTALDSMELSQAQSQVDKVAGLRDISALEIAHQGLSDTSTIDLSKDALTSLSSKESFGTLNTLSSNNSPELSLELLALKRTRERKKSKQVERSANSFLEQDAKAYKLSQQQGYVIEQIGSMRLLVAQSEFTAHQLLGYSVEQAFVSNFQDAQTQKSDIPLSVKRETCNKQQNKKSASFEQGIVLAQASDSCLYSVTRLTTDCPYLMRHYQLWPVFVYQIKDSIYQLDDSACALGFSEQHLCGIFNISTIFAYAAELLAMSYLVLAAPQLHQQCLNWIKTHVANNTVNEHEFFEKEQVLQDDAVCNERIRGINVLLKTYFQISRAISEDNMPIDRGALQEFLDRSVIRGKKLAFQDVMATEKPHNSYSYELNHLQAVTDGQPEQALRALRSPMHGEEGRMGFTPLRHAKNSVIINATLDARAAIRGGVRVESAYTMADYMILMSELCQTVEEAVRLREECTYRFAELVQKSRQKKNVRHSVLVRRLLEEMERCIFIKVSREDLVNCVGRNEDYVQRVFKEEVGESLMTHLRHIRIERAKELMISSDIKISELAEMLQFSSTSHFARIFKQFEGVSPVEFKNLYYLKQMSQG